MTMSLLYVKEKRLLPAYVGGEVFSIFSDDIAGGRYYRVDQTSLHQCLWCYHLPKGFAEGDGNDDKHT